MTQMLYWLIRSLPDIPGHNDWLSDGEREILATLRFPKRRNDWRLGRWTAKQAVCSYQMRQQEPLSLLEIRAASDGAPEASWADGFSSVSLSISHSNSRSLCVIGSCDLTVGCDLERVEPRENGLIQDYFLPEEISSTMRIPASGRDLAVNLIWSAKETVLKVLREGLRRDTRSVSIRVDSFHPEEDWGAWTGRCAEASRDFYGWWRFCEGFVYTMAADRPTSAPKQLQGI
jgi:4'-phosphopantetheinyl transferase